MHERFFRAKRSGGIWCYHEMSNSLCGLAGNAGIHSSGMGMLGNARNKDGYLARFHPNALSKNSLQTNGTASDYRACGTPICARARTLGALSMAGQPPNQPKYEVIACIAGRGFGVRKEDMKKLLLATCGKVFTSPKLDRLIESTHLKEFQTKQV